MLQTFFTRTVISNFIKNLLSKTPLPKLNFVYEGEFLIEGCTYIFEHNIIRCTQSGFLYKDISCEHKLYTQMRGLESYYTQITPDVEEEEPYYKPIYALYTIVSRYNDGDAHDLNNYCYKSVNNYYDPITHKHLGNYLRYYKWKYDVDLMPLYNCYNHAATQDIVLTYDRTTLNQQSGLYVVEEGSYSTTQEKNNYKQFIAPIRFNRPYTIAISSSTPVVLHAFIYGESGIIYDAAGDAYSSYAEFEDSHMLHYKTTFDKPFIFQINTFNKSLYNLEKYLILVIQTADTNTSSCSILEGDYTKSEVDPRSRKIYNVKHKLLECNTGDSYAFAPRLVEYLLENVITPYDRLSHNIIRTQLAMSKYDKIYANDLSNNRSILGSWDPYLTTSIKRFIDKHKENYYMTDQDGNINKEFEQLLSKIGGARIDV